MSSNSWPNSAKTPTGSRPLPQGERVGRWFGRTAPPPKGPTYEIRVITMRTWPTEKPSASGAHPATGGWSGRIIRQHDHDAILRATRTGRHRADGQRGDDKDPLHSRRPSFKRGIPTQRLQCRGAVRSLARRQRGSTEWQNRAGLSSSPARCPGAEGVGCPVTRQPVCQRQKALDLRITCNYNTRMASSAAPQLTMRQALAIPAFRKLLLATLVSIFGDFLALYAIFSEMTFRMHASARAITLVTVFFLLPLAFVGPVAGVFVDRWHPRRTMVASDIARAILVLGLVFAHAPWHIYAVFLALSTFSSFFTPARSVALPQIVPLNGLMGANALIQQTVQILQMGSPVLAGALAGWAGPSSCYYLDSASFVFSGLVIATIAIPARPAHANREVKPILRDLLSGVRFIFGHPVIGFVILS